jgi:hypothetical protein
MAAMIFFGSVSLHVGQIPYYCGLRLLRLGVFGASGHCSAGLTVRSDPSSSEGEGMGWWDQPRGKDGRWVRRGGGAIVAVSVVGAVSLGGGTGIGAGGAVSVQSASGQAVRVNVSRGKGNAKQGKRDDAWRDMGLRRLKQASKHAVNCVVNSYGEVQEFFARTPCRSLDRMLFALGDGDNNSVVVTVSWVRMRNAGNARRLQELADIYGTGSVSPLAGTLVEAADVKFTGRYYDSRRSGDLVVIAETEPLRGDPQPEFLDGLADVAAELPRP